jgi:transcription elongation factor Elf1
VHRRVNLLKPEDKTLKEKADIMFECRQCGSGWDDMVDVDFSQTSFVAVKKCFWCHKETENEFRVDGTAIYNKTIEDVHGFKGSNGLDFETVKENLRYRPAGGW